MNVDISKPQVTLLRNAVNQRLGKVPRLLTDFAAVAETIEIATGERLSASTMERFWGYSTRNTRSIAGHTLDVLARYVGYKNWPHFESTAIHCSHPDSGFISGDTIDVRDLTPGTVVRLSWLPDRVVKARYLGQGRFVVESSINSGIAKGDTFECLVIQVGHPLYLDRYQRAIDAPDTPGVRYVAGRDSGLTNVAILQTPS